MGKTRFDMRVQVVAGAAFRYRRCGDDGELPPAGRYHPMPAAAVFTKMRTRCLLISALALVSSALLATSTFAAEAGATEHESVSLKPQMLVHFGGGFGITNSMLVTWIVAAGIIILAQTAMRNPRPIPGRRQNFWEWMVEGLYTFLENIIGRDLVRKGLGADRKQVHSERYD